MPDIDVKKLIRRFEAAKTDRANFATHWQEIAEVISPAGAVFHDSVVSQGAKNNRKIYDTTGTHANELLSSGFIS